MQDDQLADAVLLVVDAEPLRGALSELPPKDVRPEIVFEYSLPRGALAQRCCFCRGHTIHRRGFLTRFGTDELYLVGSHCGPDHLGLEFRHDTGRHSKRIDRQNAVRRLREAAGRSAHVIEWSDAILFGTALRALDDASREFQKSAGDVYARLRARLASGGDLTEDVRTRDLAMEARRDAQLSGSKAGPPIYRNDRILIGRMRGTGLLQPDRVRDAVFALKASATGLAAVVSKPTDGQATAVLRRLVIEFDRTLGRAEEAAEILRDAHRFFEIDHVRILERWATDNSVDVIRPQSGGIAVGSRDNPKILKALPAFEIGRIIQTGSIDVL